MTYVKTNAPDREYNEWTEGEAGYIDGYIRAADDRPYAVVIINTRLVLIPFHVLEVIPQPPTP